MTMKINYLDYSSAHIIGKFAGCSGKSPVTTHARLLFVTIAVDSKLHPVVQITAKSSSIMWTMIIEGRHCLIKRFQDGTIISF